MVCAIILALNDQAEWPAVSYYLAIDAGGTKTEFVLADEYQELARVRGGTIKRMRADEATVTANLDAALGELSRQSGVRMNEVLHTCIGTAGETVPLVVDWLVKAFAARVGGGIEIIGDVEVALEAAFHGGRGVLVLAGTGSNVAGRSRDGSIFTAGGWGPALADQGSGHFIGLEALRRGFLARDEQRATRVLDVAMQYWQLSSIEALVEYANARPAPDYSRLTPLIVDCAAEGDEIAAEVLEQGGRDLAYLAQLVIKRVQRREESEGRVFEVPEIAIAGSVLERIQSVRVALQVALLGLYPEITFQHDAVDPVMGALWRARRAVALA
jgi:glucosamine kinase